MLSFQFILLGLSLASSSIAVPSSYRFRREVPQEHSHEAILIDIRKQLAISNPQNLGDPVFGLLGAAAAAGGLGSTTDVNCLQQATADQAFTNAKGANDVAGMTSALIYRALERNSGSVGAASPNCTSVTAVNPEVAALAQHQDPAGSGAQAFNKNLVLELAKQIASIGGTATDALKSGTFAPGQIGDPTAKGNTCDDANDTAGCIVSQNLLVPDATEDEINAAVSGVASTGSNSTSTATGSSSTSTASNSTSTDIGSADECPGTATVTVTAASETTAAAATTAAAVAATTAAAATSTAAAGAIGNFGSCSVPQIQFGVGFDGRKETAFEPVDQKSYNHGSADNIAVISQFICNTLTNSCGADATAKATCATAETAANGATAKTGAQADAFNAAFGITTNFASSAIVDDTGSTVQAGSAATAAASAATSAAAAATTTAAVAETTAAAAATTAAAAAATTAASSSGSSSTIGNFGSCSVPQIQFGVGFDNRKETSFEPVDQKSYNHGSADNIDIITQFMCDTLTNSCGADATAKATCATAKAAADTKTAKTGAQADAFNAAFGITTNFASLAVISDQGSTIQAGAAATPAASAATSAAAVATTTAAAAAETSAAAATTSAASAAATTAASSSSASGSNLQTFTGSLGGVTPPAVTDLGSGAQPFQVDGNSSFSSLQNALIRSCDVQHNKCANAANSSGNSGALTVSACADQQTQCNAVAQSTAASARR